MITKFEKYLKESKKDLLNNFKDEKGKSIEFSKEEEDALKGNDNTSMYDYSDVPKAKIKQNKTIKPKIDNNTAVYTKERIKTILKMVNVYPQYYAFVDNIYKKMIKNNWEVITVPDNIDTALSRYNGIAKTTERDRFRFLSGLKNIKLFNIKEKVS